MNVHCARVHSLNQALQKVQSIIPESICTVFGLTVVGFKGPADEAMDGLRVFRIRFPFRFPFQQLPYVWRRLAEGPQDYVKHGLSFALHSF